MASGLTNETGKNWTCESFRRDPHGLRDHAECSFLRGPSFGTVQVDWAARRVKLQVRCGVCVLLSCRARETASAWCGVLCSR
jgi:hypothetical protein